MRRPTVAFTLVEVVVAVGIFAAVITALIGLITVLQGNAAESAERADATAAANFAAAYLQAAGVSAVTDHAVNPGGDAGITQRLYLSRDLSQTGWGSAVPAAVRFFAVTVERVAAISPAGSDAANGFVAVTLRVEWPAAVLDNTSTTGVASMRSNYVILP